jgi:hypothetical protein
LPSASTLSQTCPRPCAQSRRGHGQLWRSTSTQTRSRRSVLIDDIELVVD